MVAGPYSRFCVGAGFEPALVERHPGGRIQCGLRVRTDVGQVLVASRLRKRVSQGIRSFGADPGSHSVAMFIHRRTTTQCGQRSWIPAFAGIDRKRAQQ